MKNIVLVAPYPPPFGGIANWTVLMNDYVQGRTDVELININTAPKKRGLDGRTLWDRIVVQGFSMFKHKKQLISALKHNEVDAVHITTSGQLAIFRDLMLLKAARKRKVRSVYHIRFGRIPEIAEANTREWRMMKSAMKLASVVIAIDNKTLSAIRKYAPEVNACYVPNPFDFSKMPDLHTSDADKQYKEIAFLGWVIKTKGVEELLSAWDEISSSYPEWKLRVIGPYSESYYSELKERFSLSDVIFDGEKKHDDAMQLIAASDAFILPSYTEGFPNAVLEAMALKKPIIATDVGAIPDMLIDCGIVIEPKNKTAVLDALKTLLPNQELRYELGEKAYARVKQEYSLDVVFGKYMELWLG